VKIRRSWDSKIKHALWADRITKKATTGKSPFELVYGLEARLPVHLRLPTYGSVEDLSTEQDAVQNRVNQVIELDEIRRKAYDQNCKNQSKVKKAFDNQEKIKAIMEWPTPKTLTELRGFLGMCTYYRKFVKGFSQLCAPLTDLTKKGAFKWNEEAQMTMDKMKKVMSTCPVLALPDFSLPFTLECDASGEGIGAVLMQNRHPLAYESRKLRGPELLYNIYDKEMLAIMHALAKFRQYLVGARFVVKSDHNSLKYLLEQKDLNERQQKWVSRIQAYDFDIEFVKGKNNVVADALSRRPSIFAMTGVSVDWKDHLVMEYAKDQFACQLLDGQVQDDNFKVINDLIYYKDRIFLVPGSAFKAKVLQAYHDSPMAGHQGISKTYRQVRERFSWKGLKEDVIKHVKECTTCQENKDEHTHPAGLLQPLPIPEHKWVKYP
jgi:hypothetical protein